MYLKLLANWPIFLPPITTIILSILSRRPGVSIICGICIGSALKVGGVSFGIVEQILLYFVSVFYKNGEIVWNNICIFMFLWLLGTYTVILQTTGALSALSSTVFQHVTSRKKAELLIVVAGICVFIDDYFSSLIVGSLSLPIVRKLSISREKLAYFLDSTSGPGVILVPFSSWGATILLLIENCCKNEGLGIDASKIFMSSIPYNFYALITLSLAIFVALSNWNFPLMRTCDKEALKNPFYHPANNNSSAYEKNGALSGFSSLAFLLFGTMFTMFLSGYLSTPAGSSFYQVMGNMKVGPSLLIGIIGAIISSLVLSPLPLKIIRRDAYLGYFTMSSAIQTLLLAWALSSVIQDLQLGNVVADVMRSSSIPLRFVPIMVFCLACFLSFSTGTSWATFSILIPIVFQIFAGSDIGMLYVSIGAVLGGAVFGDHSSPISDTSILASLASQCDHISHVRTQLPYCLLSAMIALAGYWIIAM